MGSPRSDTIHHLNRCPEPHVSSICNSPQNQKKVLSCELGVNWVELWILAVRAQSFWLMCLFEPVAPSTQARECVWLLHYPKPRGHTARGASMLRDTDTFYVFFFIFSLLTLFQGLGLPPAANRLWRHYIWNMKISGLWEKMSRREKQAGRKVSLPWKPPHKGRWDVTQLLFSLLHFAPKGSFSSLCVFKLNFEPQCLLGPEQQKKFW